jgi:predicted porin
MNIKFKDLNTYNIGGEVTYNQFSVIGSFMSYNKSLSNATIDTFGRETDIYAVGIKYKFLENKCSASLNHFHSDHKKNKFDATNVGMDYMIAKGIKTYLQFTRFHAKGKYIDAGVIRGDKSKGNIVILGGKISL